MKSLCKKTQKRLDYMNGHIDHFLVEYPDLAEHFKKCKVCQAEAKKLVRISQLLSGQTLHISNEPFWNDFSIGLKRKLHRSDKMPFWKKIRKDFAQTLNRIVFRPVYQLGLAFVIVFALSYFGYHSLTRQSAVLTNPYEFLYESYQEASSGNPIYRSLSDPTEEIITIAELSGDIK
ncbi:MAG TPA: hypothetical protein ENG82_01605 [Bacteroidetes bacterium]|nr:hypothetical protein BMS3Bbin03_01991 [bacterium BMS3Bbin03]HDK35573.1 hypothetical protein [Bacteroidota bacterium]